MGKFSGSPEVQSNLEKLWSYFDKHIQGKNKDIVTNDVLKGYFVRRMSLENQSNFLNRLIKLKKMTIDTEKIKLIDDVIGVVKENEIVKYRKTEPVKQSVPQRVSQAQQDPSEWKQLPSSPPSPVLSEERIALREQQAKQRKEERKEETKAKADEALIDVGVNYELLSRSITITELEKADFIKQIQSASTAIDEAFSAGSMTSEERVDRFKVITEKAETIKKKPISSQPGPKKPASNDEITAQQLKSVALELLKADEVIATASQEIDIGIESIKAEMKAITPSNDPGPKLASLELSMKNLSTKVNALTQYNQSHGDKISLIKGKVDELNKEVQNVSRSKEMLLLQENILKKTEKARTAYLAVVNVNQINTVAEANDPKMFDILGIILGVKELVERKDSVYKVATQALDEAKQALKTFNNTYMDEGDVRWAKKQATEHKGLSDSLQNIRLFKAQATSGSVVESQKRIPKIAEVISELKTIKGDAPNNKARKDLLSVQINLINYRQRLLDKEDDLENKAQDLPSNRVRIVKFQIITKLLDLALEGKSEDAAINLNNINTHILDKETELREHDPEDNTGWFKWFKQLCSSIFNPVSATKVVMPIKNITHEYRDHVQKLKEVDNSQKPVAEQPNNLNDGGPKIENKI